MQGRLSASYASMTALHSAPSTKHGSTHLEDFDWQVGAHQRAAICELLVLIVSLQASTARLQQPSTRPCLTASAAVCRTW